MTFTDNKAVRSGNGGETLSEAKTTKPQPVVVEKVQLETAEGVIGLPEDGAYSEEND